MQTSIWLILVLVAIAGALGGVVNAFLTDNGFLLPKSDTTSNGTILRPGYFGNVLVGAVAAVVSWGLYGPLATFQVAGTQPPSTETGSQVIGLSLSSLVGAVLIGIGGARWLSSEVDKTLLRAAAAEAAGKPASSQAVRELAVSTPAGALAAARAL